MNGLTEIKTSLVGIAASANAALSRLVDLEEEARKIGSSPTRIADELASIREELKAGKADQKKSSNDPFISRNKALREGFGVNRASVAAKEIIRRLPWVEISPGRYHVRRSAIQELKAKLEAEALQKQAAA